MAAFEAVSKLSVRPFDRQSLIDFRVTQLPEEKPPDDDFDPRDHREPKAPIKPWMAYFNLMRTLWGAGVLGLPLAVSQAGIILGPIMTTALGLLIIHMHLTLLWCLNEISRQLKIPYISYRYGFRIALLHGPTILHRIGEKGPMIISIFMLLSQLGICTVFVIFTTDSLRDIMDWKTSKPAILSLLIPYLFLQYFMKTLSIVSYISMLGNYLNMAGLILIIYHIFLAPHGVIVYACTDALALFFVIGTILFNLSAVAVILSIDKALKDPKVLTKPCGMLTVGMFIPTVFTTVFGVLGYWSFGTMEENVLRSLPFDDYFHMLPYPHTRCVCGICGQFMHHHACFRISSCDGTLYFVPQRLWIL
ncbi:proton-coupled amino acid transporter-like protein CG1139 isoform X2 [Pieris brassicae]|uniref:proton-coupled amino acid transporter-like protein CG1139 isoform X2 n=1 Tax=Pieris brassicae TaxID=7116 RepID=UPI001E65E269|nr:proton-coupled amino acid transporter-like protein CG1139 isoform X2 [Pieris brassicae]